MFLSPMIYDHRYQDFDYHCHSNLVRAIAPFGLRESDVHDGRPDFHLISRLILVSDSTERVSGYWPE